jgi:hypothetical protein
MTEARGRPDPYDLVFGVEAMDDRLFPPIAEEAGARGLTLDDPDRFLFLTSVGHLLQAIAGPAESPNEAGQAGELMKQHGRLLFHAFHFWHTGKRIVELDEPQLRRLLDGEVVGGDWTLATPAAAGYVRLPANLVWASPAPGLRPEPADGFFWSFDSPALHLLMALGVRPDRPGFSVVTTTGMTDTEPHWGDVDARPGGRDFATTLPGGELDRLYSVETAAELLKLASLCFRELERGG